ncbi:prepilin peptidase [Aquimarina sp. SS2-1]|uniref:prepilin peptidase n=1 Tax=Aquimarina besae TaxID=3342247 RepID=UPI003671481B
MDTVIQIIIILLFTLVFIQDLKLRAIHISLPILILIFGLISYFRNGYSAINLLYSLAFLIITFGGLYFYLSAKNKRFTNPFKRNMGLGDVLFFVAVIPFFSLHNYILFFITGMLFSIVGFLTIKLVVKTDLVPLAGLLALYLIILKIASYSAGFDVFFTNLLN